MFKKTGTMKHFLCTMLAVILSLNAAQAQKLKFMGVLMGSPSADFKTMLAENEFDEPVKQGNVDFYKNGKFEDKTATVAIYNNDADKINRIVAYIEVESEGEANTIVKDLGERFIAQNQGYILKDLSQNGKILHIFSKKDDYAEYIAIEFAAGEKKLNVQYILAQ